MKHYLTLLALAGLFAVPGAFAQTADLTPPPAWAAPYNPDFKPMADAVLQRLPGSSQAFSRKQARNLYFSPDWHPENHPEMPAIVATGRQPDVFACGSCHRAEGTGGPENASLAGLPEAYLVQQLADFKSGARTGYQNMVNIGKALTQEEARIAAKYYAALSFDHLIEVVEAETIPKVFIAGFLFAKDPAGGTEPLGKRIVEVPNDLKQFELRDSKSRFTVYVPPGSIQKGKTLVEEGPSGGVACAVCHGADLKGLAQIPGIASRSPTYLFRQLHYFKHGQRAGPSSALMIPQVAQLTRDDMIAIAAYLATQSP